jgi:hypothetical protein
VYQGDRVIGSAVADLPRKDLVAARIGDGRYGFQVKLSLDLLRDRSEKLQVYAMTARGRFLLERGAIAVPAGATKVPRLTHGLPTAGLLERTEGSVLHGWAYNPDQPNAPATIDVYDDERYLGSATADRERPTSADLGLAGSARGFVFDLGSQADSQLRERLRARVAGTTFELVKSPRFLGMQLAGAAAPTVTVRAAARPKPATVAVLEENDDEQPDDSAADATAIITADSTVGLVILATGAEPKDVVTTIRSWAAQTTLATTAAVVWQGNREDIVENLADEVVRSLEWLDTDLSHDLQVFLRPLEFVVFALPGDVFEPNLASLLARLSGLPDVVAWSNSVEGRSVMRSGDALRFETFLQRSPIGAFAVRRSALARYPGSLANEMRRGMLHAVRVWLALQPELVWSAIEAPIRNSGSMADASVPDASTYGRIVNTDLWALREVGEMGSSLVPKTQPQRISVGIWRGLDRDHIVAIQSLLTNDFGGAIQFLVPTSGSEQKGKDRLARIKDLCDAVPDRVLSQKLVTCGETQAACCAALLAAADGEVVILLDGYAELPAGSLRETLAWALCQRAGVVTTSLRDEADLAIVSAANLMRDGATLAPCLGDQDSVVDGVAPTVMVIEKRKAVEIAGIDAANYPDAWFALEFCLRMRLSGYYSVRLAHISTATHEPAHGPVYPAELPLPTRVLFRAAHLLDG